MAKAHDHHHHSSSRSKSSKSHRSQADPQSTPSTIKSTEDHYHNTNTSTTAKDRIDEINERTTRNEALTNEEELALKRKLVPRLAKRAYHLEDENTWCQDWVQYQRNTHPVFGLCLYHRFHPIRFPQRVIILVGSIAFGFAITNCVYLGFLSNENAGNTVNLVYNVTGIIAQQQEKYTTIDLEQSMVFLLTVGSFLHSAFDMMIWYMMACFCFRPGGICFKGSGEGSLRAACRNFGIYLAVLVVMVIVAAATSVAIIRLNEDEEQREADTMAQQFAEEQTLDESSDRWSFIVGYALELVVALFIFYPITSTVFFSGIMGCGRLPVIGGRPYEMWRARLKSQRRGDRTSESEEDDDDEDALGLQAYNV